MLAEFGSLWLEGLEAHFFVDYQCCGQQRLEDVSQLLEVLCLLLFHDQRQRQPMVFPFHASELEGFCSYYLPEKTLSLERFSFSHDRTGVIRPWWVSEGWGASVPTFGELSRR